MGEVIRTLHHDPDGYACNMAYVVRANESEIYRGPYWRAKMISNGDHLTLGEIK